eukprot:GFUD01045233.1.p1 GENE.GFUD01045233.1~~GFUD01045233.1.p1  ORF type:complete len:109 (-),score=42.57 GFUD01045233.1:44-370(-)
MSAVTTMFRSVPRLMTTPLARMMSGETPQRFGHSNGDSGWRWDNNGVGMGGKDAGPGTEAKEGLGKGNEYEVPEFFEFNKYSYFDIEKDMVDGNVRVEQPKSGLTEFW